MFRTKFCKLLILKHVLIVVFLVVTSCKYKRSEYSKIQGNVFGTTFHIKCLNEENIVLTKSIDSLFGVINGSLSTYHSTSLISAVNDDALELKVDNHFKNVFALSKDVFTKTSGYFDPTIGKMVNLWGFGPDGYRNQPSKFQVDSLMNCVGFDKVVLNNDVVCKENSSIFLDFNAIAKGYGVDVVGLFLESKNINNYLVEIGGEIRARGKNPNGGDWSVGIEDPNYDGTRSIQKVISLKNEAIATSGNYRKFKIDEITGQKIAHTLDPKTGFPAKTDLLSVSVIAPLSCAEVDAYATAFMAMGFKKSKEISEKFPNMKLFCIYLENDRLQTYETPGLTFKN